MVEYDVVIRHPVDQQQGIGYARGISYNICFGEAAGSVVGSPQIPLGIVSVV